MNIASCPTCFRYLAALLTCSTAGIASYAAPAVSSDYCVVVSSDTYADSDWRKVADALVEKHDASVIVYPKTVEQCLPTLKARFPRWTGFVARPQEAGRDFVTAVHQLTRKLDDDPYTDTRWGIVTGYDAENALRIARHAEPLTIRRVAAGTELAMEMVTEGEWYCELEQNRMVRKRPGEQPQQLRGPDDTTAALVAALCDYRAQLFVTSGHATERDWQIGFRYRNGSFRCERGRLYGRDSHGKRYPIDAPEPKVYLPVGNCLMGHIDSTDAMALAWMNSAGVNQMVGYTVPTWFGYAGWGCLDFFVEQPGRFTFNEAFFANHHALVNRLEKGGNVGENGGADGGDKKGLLFDRDAVAFYGDPAWEARLAPGPMAWHQTLSEEDGVYTFTITPQRGSRTFQPINTNGSQRGYRPIVEFLPHRVQEVEILAGKDLGATVVDDFLLVPLPRGDAVAEQYRLVFRATRKELPDAR